MTPGSAGTREPSHGHRLRGAGPTRESLHVGTEQADGNTGLGHRLYSPLVLALAYLGGTYVLFLILGDAHRAPDLLKLSLFVLATLVALIVGYHLKARRYSRNPSRPIQNAESPTSTSQWVVISGIYYAAFGLALLLEYGATGPSDVLESLTSPGQAYAAKFRVYEEQQASGDTNAAIQILTLLSGLYAPLVPFTILFWRRLSMAVRSVAVAGVLIYAAFFLFIGTMKGFGDLAIFTIATSLILMYGAWLPEERRRLRRRRSRVVLAILLVALAAYMANSQSERQVQFGIAGRVESNPVAETLFGEEVARGVTSVLWYPTHGYLGLAYNLDTPFEWASMRGGSRALDSYWAQYVGGPSVYESTYPARTEMRTGWPALRYWTTAYPWFASDLTFPGTVLLMGVAGWFLCRMWFEAAFMRSRIAVLLFAQFALFIAFIPANNQIGTGRPSLITFFTLVSLYILGRAPKPRRVGR